MFVAVFFCRAAIEDRLLKLCSSCLFRAQDEAKICMTCGSTALQKLEFTAEGYTLKSRITSYLEDMRAACDQSKPYFREAGGPCRCCCATWTARGSSIAAVLKPGKGMAPMWSSCFTPPYVVCSNFSAAKFEVISVAVNGLRCLILMKS
jgi:hypothetical protein